MSNDCILIALSFLQVLAFISLAFVSYLMQKAQPHNIFWKYFFLFCVGFFIAQLGAFIFLNYGVQEALFLQSGLIILGLLIFTRYLELELKSVLGFRIRTWWFVVYFLLVLLVSYLLNIEEELSRDISLLLVPVIFLTSSFLIFKKRILGGKKDSLLFAVLFFFIGFFEVLRVIFPKFLLVSVFSLLFLFSCFFISWSYFYLISFKDKKSVFAKLKFPLLFLLILVLSMSSLFLLRNKAIEESKKTFLKKIEITSKAINKLNLKELKGGPGDLKKAQYIRLKEQLRAVLSEYENLKFMYLLGLKEGQIIFYLDTEPDTSEDYAPPGSFYESYPKMLLDEVFKKGVPKACGPYTDKWGEWVSSFVPIKDNVDGKIISVLGADISSSDFYFSIRHENALNLMGFIFLFVLFFMSLLVFYLAELSKLLIKESEEKFSKAFNNSPVLSAITRMSDGLIIETNKAFLDVLEFKKEEILGKTTTDLNLYNNPEDRKLFIEKIKQDGFVKNFEIQTKASSGKELRGLISASIISLRGEYCLLSNIVDVTERVKTVQDLRDRENYLKILWNSINAGVALIDAETHKISDINDAGLKILGAKNREELVGGNCKVTCSISNLGGCPILDKGEVVNNKKVFIKRLDGQVIPITKTAEIIEIKGKKYILESFVDVSEVQKAQELLEENEQKLKTLFSNIPGIAYRCLLDEYWTMLFMSKDIDDITGYPVQDFINNEKRSYGSIIHFDDAGFVEEKIKKAIDENKSWDIEYRIFNKDGSVKWVHERGRAVKDTQGDVQFLDGIIVDVTDRKKAQEEYQKLSLAIEQSPSVVVLTDVEGNIQYTNPKFSEVTGYTAEEAKGQNPRILKTDYLPPETYKELWKTITAGKDWKGEFHNKRKDGSLFWENASIGPVKDSSGTIVGFFAVKEDVTHRKLMEEQLKTSQKNLLKAMKVKDEFLSVTSHDLKSPLGIIKTSMHLLLEEDSADEGVKEYAYMSLRQADRGLKLISSLLDLSKLEDGNVQLDIKNFVISKLINEVLEDPRINLEQDNICINLVQSSDYELTADYNKIVQVLSNLVGNAIKFSNKGSKIDIITSLNDKVLRIAVKDFGSGIPSDKLSSIFEKHVKLKDGREKGHGIGLTIAKMIVELHNGKIWVESLEGEGSTFYFELPNAKPSDSSFVEDSDLACSFVVPGTKTILVVDDMDDERKVVNDILSSAGFKVLESSGWESALKIIRESRIDLVILDIEMPEINGLELLDIIRREFPIEKLPVVLYSSRFTKIDDASTYGANSYINKGLVKPSDFLDKIRKLLSA
jgi:PAS domain S-box-containing protein